MSDNFNKERIIKNTGLLYLRMAFTMWLNLYATRLVLKNLGVDDMGVYGVVGSIVSLFAVFSNGITTAIQRFITFELGKPDGKINTIFCTSINIIFLLSGVIFLLLETLGVWYLTNKANIPEASTNAAFWVFQISVLTCIINLISVPYNALIVAHEKMNVFASISIIRVVLSCAAAYCISYFNNHRLLIYAALLAGIGILIRIIYQTYCRKRFKEAQYRWMIDRDCMKEMGKFAGITTLSGILQTLSAQGIVLIINITFGVAINAVYAISLQVKNSVLSFAFNIFKAIAPQITKTYANGEIETCKKLVYTGSKVQAYLIFFIMIPFLFRTEYIMQLWLDEVPPYAVEFAQCAIFISLFYALFEPIRTLVYATNHITHFLIISDSISVLLLPIAYGIGKYFQNPSYMMVFIVAMEFIACGIRIYIARKVSFIRINEIIMKIIVPMIIVGIISCLSCYYLTLIVSYSIMGLLLLLIIQSIILFFCIYIFGLNHQEKNILLKKQ